MNSMRTLRYVLAPLVLGLAALGCVRHIGNYAFSPVLEGGFDPVSALRRGGLKIDVEANGERLRNAVSGYGSQSWCGTVATDKPPLKCDSVAILIRDELNCAKGASCHDELTVKGETPATKPLTGMLQYNKDKMHGDVYIWLIPDQTAGTVHYAIFVREEPLE